MSVPPNIAQPGFLSVGSKQFRHYQILFCAALIAMKYDFEVTFDDLSEGERVVSL